MPKLPDRPFRYWKFDRHLAIDPDNDHALWIANGFSAFRDYRSARHQLLKGLTLRERWKLWRAYKRELRIRSLEALNKSTTEQKGRYDDE